jgi:hypothetical protein
MSKTIIDTYIENDAAIKRLETEQKEIREFLLSLGEETLAGTHRSIKISHSERKSVDWKTLAAEQRIPKEVVESFTKVSTVTTLRIT